MEVTIPAWAQQITLFGVMIASVILGIWKYVRTEADKIGHKSPSSEDTSSVTSASFVDSKLVKELIDTLREHEEELGRQTQRETRSEADLREAIIENTESIHLNTNAVLNMLRFMKRQDGD